MAKKKRTQGLDINSQPEPEQVQQESSPEVEPITKLDKSLKAETEVATAAATVEPQPQQPEPEPQDPGTLNQALIKSYHAELDKQIKKGLAMVMDRYVRLQSQERPPDWRAAVDEKGNSSNWYYNLYWAIKDGVEPGSKDDIYMKLETLGFTKMRKLDAIRQEYPIS